MAKRNPKFGAHSWRLPKGAEHAIATATQMSNEHPGATFHVVTDKRGFLVVKDWLSFPRQHQIVAGPIINGYVRNVDVSLAQRHASKGSRNPSTGYTRIEQQAPSIWPGGKEKVSMGRSFPNPGKYIVTGYGPANFGAEYGVPVVHGRADSLADAKQLAATARATHGVAKVTIGMNTARRRVAAKAAFGRAMRAQKFGQKHPRMQLHVQEFEELISAYMRSRGYTAISNAKHILSALKKHPDLIGYIDRDIHRKAKQDAKRRNPSKRRNSTVRLPMVPYKANPKGKGRAGMHPSIWVLYQPMNRRWIVVQVPTSGPNAFRLDHAAVLERFEDKKEAIAYAKRISGGTKNPGKSYHQHHLDKAMRLARNTSQANLKAKDIGFAIAHAQSIIADKGASTQEMRAAYKAWDEMEGDFRKLPFQNPGAFGSRRKTGRVDQHCVRELLLWIDNTEPLYRQKMAIYENLNKKRAKGVYTTTKSPKLFMYLVERAVADYTKWNGSPFGSTMAQNRTATKRAAAVELAREYGSEHRFEKRQAAKNPRQRPAGNVCKACKHHRSVHTFDMSVPTKEKLGKCGIAGCSCKQYVQSGARYYPMRRNFGTDLAAAMTTRAARKFKPHAKRAVKRATRAAKKWAIVAYDRHGKKLMRETFDSLVAHAEAKAKKLIGKKVRGHTIHKAVLEG